MGEAKQRKDAMDDLFAQAPTYRCHKIVKALQIGAYFEGPGILDFGPGFPKARPPSQLFARYKPKPGDYIVFYDDGYVSISPQLAFENGYTRIEAAAAAMTAAPHQPAEAAGGGAGGFAAASDPGGGDDSRPPATEAPA